jgi:hypothetical protein
LFQDWLAWLHLDAALAAASSQDKLSCEYYHFCLRFNERGGLPLFPA